MSAIQLASRGISKHRGSIVFPQRVSLTTSIPAPTIIPGLVPSILQSAVLTGAGVLSTYSATFGATPTNGNDLVAICNSDATVTTPSGWTLVETVVASSGFYVWTKTAGVSEPATVTVTPTVVADGGLIILELANTAGVDVSATPVQVSTAGTTALCASITTTADGDLVLAIGGVHEYTVAPSGISYNNSFTAKTSALSTAVAGTAAGCFCGYLVKTVAGAVGATTISWTSSTNNYTGVLLSFFSISSVGGVIVTNPGDQSTLVDTPTSVQVVTN